MTIINTRWKPGARIKADSDDAYAFIEGIKADNEGEATPELLVKKSRAKASPLHGDFEWNDKVAGHKYRLSQARYILRSIEVERPQMPNVFSRAFESITVTKTDNKRTPAKKVTVFKSTEDLIRDPASRAVLLQQAIKDLAAFRKRYAVLSELTVVIGTIDSELSKLADDL